MLGRDEAVRAGSSAPVILGQTPEERELSRKLEELAHLEEQLGESEEKLETLRAELRALERRYLAVVGVCYARLDAVLADIAQAEAAKAPEDEARQFEARKSRENARASAEELGDTAETQVSEVFRPLAEQKKLYRDIARRIHPDLAVGEEDRLVRERLMTELNCAYAQLDEERMRAVLCEWEMAPEAILGDGVGSELVRVVRKIAQAEARLDAIAKEMEELEHLDLFALKLRVEAGTQRGVDVLADLAAQIDRQVAECLERLHSIGAVAE